MLFYILFSICNAEINCYNFSSWKGPLRKCKRSIF